MRVRDGNGKVIDLGPADGRSWFDPRQSDAQRQSKSRRDHLRAKYGITEEEYNALHDAQGGVCAICRKPETVVARNGKPRRLAVDHDHTTGRVRGLLCQRCNVLCGLLGDDEEWAAEFAALMGVYVRRGRIAAVA